MTSSEPRSFLSILLAASLVLGAISAAPRVALAQSAPRSAADIAQARELFNQAREMRDAGDMKGALEKFKAAHALGGTPVTGLELGKTYAQLGMLVEARETFLSIGRSPVTSSETARSTAARQEASQLSDQIEPRIPKITIRVKGVSLDRAAITIDGVEVPSAALVAARLVNPGSHTVVASSGASRDEAKVDLREREQKTVDLKLTPAPIAPIAAVASPASASPPNSSREEPSRHTSPLVYLGFGVGGAALATGAITGVIAMSKASSVKSACDGLTCPKSVDDDLQSGRTMGTVSTIAFVVAGAGVTLGVVGLLAGGRSEEPRAGRRIEPWISPGAAGVRGEF